MIPRLMLAEPHHRSRAVLYLVLTAIMWSLGGLLIKLVAWNPMAIGASRSLIAAITLFILVRKPKFHWSFDQVAGAVFYCGTVVLFPVATKLTTAADAILLQYTAPIYVALLGTWLLGERPAFADWLNIVAVLAGMLLFFTGHLSASGFWGNVCAVASAVTYALFVIFMRRQKHASPLESVLLGNILATLCGLPFMFKGGPGASGWVALVLLGVVQLGLPYILYAKAIKHVTALEAILIPVLEPILNPLWVMLFAGETPAWTAAAGGSIVLGSVVVRGLVAVLRSGRTEVERVGT
ncbi:MAG: DMT family transporter [Blastocatellia bacterium]